MKDLSNTTLWEFLESIREKTRENIMIIRKNKRAIIRIEEQILNSISENPEIIIDLETQNKQLSEENYQLLELHKSIISLGEQYSLYTNLYETKNELGKEVGVHSIEPEYITLIREGKFDVDKHFYWLTDKKIADEIYDALLKLERYEDCSRILRLSHRNKESINASIFKAFLGLFSRGKKRNTPAS